MKQNQLNTKSYDKYRFREKISKTEQSKNR